MSRARDGRRPTRRDGFLLTETLATFTLSAFVLLGMVMGASMLVRAVDRSAAKVQAGDDLERALAALGRDIAGIERARWAGEEPQAFVFRGGPNSLEFVRTESLAGGVPARHVVSLREILVNGAPTLTRSDAPLPVEAQAFADLHFGPPRPLPTGAARLRFAYVPAARAGVAVPARLPAWPSDMTLPAAVIVEAVDAATGRLLVSERFPVRADAEIGCLVSRGSRPAAKGENAAAPNTGAAGGTSGGGGGSGGPNISGGLGSNGGLAVGGGAGGLSQQSAGSMNPGGGAGPASATGGSLAAPPREPPPDFCGRADKDDKMDGSGPRERQGAVLP